MRILGLELGEIIIFAVVSSSLLTVIFVLVFTTVLVLVSQLTFVLVLELVLTSVFVFEFVTFMISTLCSMSVALDRAILSSAI